MYEIRQSLFRIDDENDWTTAEARPWRKYLVEHGCASWKAIKASIRRILLMKPEEEAAAVFEELFATFIRLEPHSPYDEQAQARYIQRQEKGTIKTRAEEILMSKVTSLTFQFGRPTKTFRKQTMQAFAGDMVPLTHPDYRFLVDDVCSSMQLDMSSDHLEEYGTKWMIQQKLLSFLVSVRTGEAKD